MMKRLFCLILVCTFFIPAAFAQTKFEYPKAKKVEQVDDYHGTKVSDPYRWMEATETPDVAAWIEAQNKITADYLATIPQRDAIREKLTKLWNYERYSAPFKRGKNYFYSKNDGLQNQNVIYIADSITDPGRVFFDPNKLSTDGTVALNGMSFTDDGKLMAYALSTAGSDRTTWHVREVETGKELPDTLRPNRQGGVSWLKDNSGFFYSRFPDAEKGQELKGTAFNQKIYFHKLGTPQSDDYVVYERPDDKEYFVGGGVSEDGNWLIINVGKGTSRKNMVYFKNLTAEKAPILPLVDKIESDYSFLGNDEGTFYFRTDKGAPKGKIVKVNALTPKPEWIDVVPEAAETLGRVSFINNQFVVTYLKDAYTQIKIYGIDGKFVRDVKLPGIGSAGGFGGRREDHETFYSYSSYNTPPTIYQYNMKTGESKQFRQAKVDIVPDNYEVKQQFFKSKDGTDVPMFIVHKKGIKLDGTNPTIVYGYGGFNIPQTPGFSVARMVWLDMGGVYAVVNLRGGSEYGEAWHEAGTKLKKQNVFDDFIGATEWLIANKYTSPKKVAIQGGSNGGLLVGAVLNQRPELFGAALPAVGVMDMLRFTQFTVGRAWTSDYGSPENPEEFKALYAYSPLHNVKPGTKYPATMVTTADHDDRVFPAHSFKYTAAMQAAQAGNAPILIRIETKAGHGGGKPTAKIIEEQVDIYGFLMKNLGMQ
jgi:prolyl oligopeptidase